MTEILPENAHDTNSVPVFAAHVAHDLNNLLTGILGNLELLQNRAKRSGAVNLDGYIESARNAGTRAAAFAVRLLAFSGQAAREPAPVLVGEVLGQAAEVARAGGLAVQVTDVPDQAAVFCDATQFDLAIAELVKNAAAALRPGGIVTLSAVQLGGMVVVRIADNGAGMAPDVLARCRLPFFSTEANGTGRGLGLPIAERFVLNLGGGFDITSRPGAGTSVTLQLPLVTVP
jgi:signal transduction histidine kinase